MKTSKSILITGIILIAIIIGIVGFSSIGNVTKSFEYDDFTKCLTENNVKMYGAYWCSHCKDQKQMFGDSWKHINYVECSLPNMAGQNQICRQANIKAYPTWEFEDRKRIEGTLSFKQLSRHSNCELEK